MKFTITALVAALMSFGAIAQNTLPAAPVPSVATAAAVKDMAEAEVRKVDKDAKKVTLKHGPIKNLDMPGMTMVFQVRDASLFDKFAAGDKIMFTAEQLQGAFVMTGAEKVEAK
jgi:Cu(I)/Ag(I) efflux system periplasmic protein CusF